MTYYNETTSQFAYQALKSYEYSPDAADKVSASQLLLDDALKHFSQTVSQRARTVQRRRAHSDSQGQTPESTETSDNPGDSGEVPGLFRAQGEIRLKRISPEEMRRMKEEHESNRAQLVFELSRDIQKSQLSDTDKGYLRRLERALIDGNLKSFENTLRELSDVQRAYLVAQAANDLKPLGYDIFQVRATSMANGGNVGDHDSVVAVRHGDTIVETHSDPRVPNATYDSPFNNYMPRVAVSDTMPYPDLGTTARAEREWKAKSAFALLADRAVNQYACGAKNRQ